MIRVTKHPSYYGCNICGSKDLLIHEVEEIPLVRSWSMPSTDIPVKRCDLKLEYYCFRCNHKGEYIIPASRLEDFEIEWTSDIMRSDFEIFIDKQRVSPCKHHTSTNDCMVLIDLGNFKCPFHADPEKCILLKKMFELFHK